MKNETYSEKHAQNTNKQSKAAESNPAALPF